MVNWYFRNGNNTSNEYATYITDPLLAGKIFQQFNTNYPSPCGQFSTGSPASPDVREKKFGKIVRDELSFSQNDSTIRYQNKNYLYSELRNEPAIINLGSPDDYQYMNYYNQLNATNIEPLMQVIDDIDSSELILAYSINQQLTPANKIESISKTVNSIYLNYLISNESGYTQYEIDELLLYADLDADTSGTAVYSARVMLGIEPLLFGNKMLQQDVQENEIPAEFTIYPNPADNQVTVKYTGANVISGHTIEFFDVFGNLVLSAELNEEISVFSILKLSQGVYFFRIKNNYRDVQYGKLIRL